MLQKKGTLQEVEMEFGIDYESEFTPTSSAASQVNTIIDDSKATSHLEELFHHCSNLAGRSGRKALSDLIERILPLSGRFELINMLDNVFFSVAEMEGIKSNPSRFISLSVQAMKNLQSKKKSNLLFKFAQCVGKQRPDDSDTLMPMDRMPFGLLQYQIELFTCCNT